jgi:hypothetical protein
MSFRLVVVVVEKVRLRRRVPYMRFYQLMSAVGIAE